MSLYQVSTRASRRRRIGVWLRTQWNRRTGSGRHHQAGDVSSRSAHVRKVVEHAPTAIAYGDGPASTVGSSANAIPKVPQQRPPSRTTSVYPNAYRAR
jgi:hypothetical protein